MGPLSDEEFAEIIQHITDADEMYNKIMINGVPAMGFQIGDKVLLVTRDGDAFLTPFVSI